MATYTVTTLDDEVFGGNDLAGETGDGGGLSLREAIGLADALPGADKITFAADLAGGAITLANGALVLASDVAIDGDVSGDGGAPEITIDANGASRVINVTAGSSALNGLIITGGNAGESFFNHGGGVLAVRGATLAIVDSVITGNSVGGNGGGLHNAGTLTLANTTVSANNGAFSGGGIWNGGTVTLTNTTLSDNSARSWGGGIHNVDTMTLINSTVSGNSVTGERGHGGGISNYDYATATLTNITVSGNSAHSAGGINNGIYHTNMTLSNAIVLGNSAAIGQEHVAGFTSNGPNILGGNASDVFAATVDNNGVDAGLLADNGGTVQTIALKDNVSNPALDAVHDRASIGVTLDETALGVDVNGDGDTDDLIDDISDFPFDARGTGFDRIVDQTAITAPSQVDLGAVELQQIVPSPVPPPRPQEAASLVVTTTADVVDRFDGKTSLREAVALANHIAPGSLADGDADEDGVSTNTITFAPGLAGGAISLTKGELVILSDVTIDGDVSGDGGKPEITLDANGASRVIYVAAGSSTLDGLVVTGGDSSGIAVSKDATVALTNSSVLGNSTLGSGGGIRNFGTLTVTNTTVSGNSGRGGGGGILNNGTVTLNNTTVSDNNATNFGYYSPYSSGGGIENGGTAILTNTTVSGNSTSGDGGGIWNGLNGIVRLTNTTVSGNNAEYTGGGIASYGRGVVSLTNSIVLGNSAKSPPDIAGDYTSGGSNIITGAAEDVFAAIVDNNGVDAGQLADNGGAVQTIALKNHASNPALDAGDDSAAIGATLDEASLGVDVNGDGDTGDIIDDISDVPFDARGSGFDRIVDQTAITASNQIDLGAIELQQIVPSPGQEETPSLVVTTTADVVDQFDGETSLREAVALANASSAGSLDDGDEGGGPTNTITFAADLAGGAITLANGQLVLASDVVIDGDVSGDGGAPEMTIDANDSSRVIDIAGGSSTLNGLVVSGGNAVGSYGGGVRVAGGATLLMSNSVVSGNRAEDGGGIGNDGTVTLITTTVSKNSAEGGSTGPDSFLFSDGGGIDNNSALTLINTTVSGNSAEHSGGGIRNDGTVTLTNTTVSGNTTVSNFFSDLGGGGIWNGGTATLTNTTVSGNSDFFGDGGGIVNGVRASARLANTIVLGNSSENGLETVGIINENGPNIIGGTATDIFAEVVDNDGVDAGLLADNGGAVQTIALKKDANNPALDAGDDTASIGATLNETALGADVNGDGDTDDVIDDISDVPFDARGSGFDRFVDQAGLTANDPNQIDLGAVELQQIVPPPGPQEAPSLVVTTTADVVDRFDGETSLREAVALANASSAGSLDDAEEGGGPINTITFAADLAGGAITLANGQLVLASDVVIDGDVSGDGGAPEMTIDANDSSRVINITAGFSILDGLVITGGDTGGGVIGTEGGGILVASGAAVAVVNSSVTGNYAVFGGGIFGDSDATTALINATVSGNSGYSNGGGIHNRGTATLTNTTVSGNISTGGGGILNTGTATLTNTTVSGNRAEGGGGIAGGGTSALTNSIVLGNSATYYAEIVGGYTSGGPNIVEGVAADIFAAIDVTTGGGLLADNGGAVQTIALRKSVNNPALDAGNDMAPIGVTLDETALGFDLNGDGDTDDVIDDISDFPFDGRGGGAARFFDLGDVANNGANTVDLGAFELQQSVQPTVPVFGTPDNDSLPGTAFGDTISGLGGNDTIDGLGGDDVLNGAGDGDGKVGAGCVRVRFVSEAAANHNTYGWYDTKTLEAGILVANTDTTANPGVQDFVATLPVAPDDIDTLGFFLIPNGFRRNDDPGDPFADGDGTDLDLRVINSGGIWKLRDADSGYVFEGTGGAAYFSEADKNPGGLDHVMEEGELLGDGQVTHSWEDQRGLGDRDFNDLVFQVEAPYTVQVRFISESAANQSTYGYYHTGTGAAHILAANVDTATNPGIEGFTATLSLTPDAIEHLGFFLIPNGYLRNGDAGEPFAGGDGTDLDLEVFEDGDTWKIRDTGSGYVFEGTGNAAYFSEAGKNPDGLDHVMEDGDLLADGTVTQAWEDQRDLGDQDFNDVVFDVSLGCGAGSAGDDVLTGGTGDDTLSGGPGADTFRYEGTGFGRDRITDFAHGEDKMVFEDVGSADDPEDLTYTVGNFGGGAARDIRISFAGLGADLAEAWIDVLDVGSDVDALKADLVFV